MYVFIEYERKIGILVAHVINSKRDANRMNRKGKFVNNMTVHTDLRSTFYKIYIYIYTDGEYIYRYQKRLMYVLSC